MNTRAWMAGLAVMAMCATASSAANNLVTNPDFKDGTGAVPNGWDHYTSLHARVALTNWMGASCVRLTTQDKVNAFQGLVQKVPVVPGEKYTVSVQILNCRDKPLTGSAYVQLVVEWLSAGDREVGRTWSDRFGLNLSRVHWSRIALQKLEAPKEATSAKIGVHLFDGDRNGGGAILINQMQFLAP